MQRDETEADVPRTCPSPASISAQAQAALAAIAPVERSFPAADDRAGWRAHVATIDAALAGMWDARPAIADVALEAATVRGVQVVHATPAAPRFGTRRVYLGMHGGALIYLGGAALAPWARFMASRIGTRIVSVDYRMPPDHPYPAGLDDCVTVYEALLAEHDPCDIVVGGSSAGGNLAAALMLRLRAAGRPLPAGLVLLSPEVDLTESGDTFRTLSGLDRLASLMPINRLYAGDVALDDPLVSPLFGDLRGLPPTFLQSGTRDLFLSNTVRMHRRLRDAGVAAELHVWEAMPHGGFMGAPEDEQLDEELRRFLGARWAD